MEPVPLGAEGGHSPKPGIQASDKDVWERLISAVERGVAQDFFLVQHAFSTDSTESAISADSETSITSGRSGGSDRNSKVTTPSHEPVALKRSLQMESFPPPLLSSTAPQMGELEDEEFSQRKAFAESCSSSSGIGSMERRQPLTAKEAPSPGGTRKLSENRSTNVTAVRLLPRGSAPIFKPATSPNLERARNSDVGTPAASLDLDKSYQQREILLIARATRLAEEACIKDNEPLLQFLLDSNTPATSDLLDLGCCHGSVNCVKLLHERYNLPFSADMMMHAVARRYGELAVYLAASNWSTGRLAVNDVETMLVSAISAVSIDLLGAVKDVCVKTGVMMTSIVRPLGHVLMTALVDNVLRSSDPEHVENGAGLLHFLVVNGVPLLEGLAKTGHDVPETSQRKQELLVTFLETLISHSDAVRTAEWGGLPLCFCSNEIFFQQSSPRGLVVVKLDNNKLSSLPGVLFDGTMSALRVLNASHNNIASLDSLQSTSEDFSGSRLEELDLSFNAMGNFPTWLGQLPGLLKLNLNSCLRETTDARELAASGCTESVAQRKASRRFNTWAARELRELNMANNGLPTLPDFVEELGHLEILDISKNALTNLDSVCRGCVRLQVLKASHNKFLDFSDDECGGLKETLFGQFQQSWHHTLREVDLSHNKLLEVPHQLCMATALVKLNLSNNDIGQVPGTLQWACTRLATLNLANNQLGEEGFATLFHEVIAGANPRVSPFAHRRVREQWRALHSSEKGTRRVSTTGGPEARPCDSVIELPADDLFFLHTLDLSGNKLVDIPLSVCFLRKLVSLDLSNNVDLRELRLELGFLTQLFWLAVENCEKVQTQIEPFMDPGTRHLNVTKLLSSMLTTLRMERPFYGVKLAVVGDETSGKTQLIAAMKTINGRAKASNTRKMKNERECSHSDLVLTADGQPVIRSSADDAGLDIGRQISFDTWDVSDIEVFVVMRRALFMNRTLFLIVWNAATGEAGWNGVRTWLRDIQALTAGSSVIVVATHADTKLVNAEFKRTYQNLMNSLTNNGVQLFFVSSQNGSGIADLRRAIHSEAKAYCERLPKVPRSYITLYRRFTNPKRRDNPAAPLLSKVGLDGIMTNKEVMEIFNLSDDVKRDMLNEEEIVKAGSFLHDSGALVHFHDLHQHLDDAYFINVLWLVQSIIYFMNFHYLYVDAGILIPSASKAMFGERVIKPENIQILNALLEKMRVIFAIGSGHRRRFLVTFALPKEKPAHEVNSVSRKNLHTVKRIKRVFRVEKTPPELWGVLVSQLQVKLENWARGQYKGDVSNVVHTVIWAKGIIGFLPTSAFKVESAEGLYMNGTCHRFTGINVIVISMNNNYSVLALIMQHIRTLLEDIFSNIGSSFSTGTLDSRTCVIPCPACSNDYIVLCTPEAAEAMGREQDHTEGRARHPHFLSFDECAGLLALQQTDTCPNSRQELRPEEIVPDLMFCDLPQHLILDEIDVQQGTRLEAGAFGTVYRCRIDDKDVAVKVYTTDEMLQKQHHMSTLRSASESGRPTMRNVNPSDMGMRSFRSELSEIGTPMLKSLEEAQREASRLNRLQHPCIVEFLGASTRPPSIVLEYAPMGDLGHYLKSEVQRQSKASAMSSKLVIQEFPDSVLGRQLTFQIAYQVALGIRHVHRHGMIYKDLKADNVLLFSADPNQVPNVKLTDYGIASEDMPGVEVGGIEGTPGFQAPEVLLCGTLSAKVDIYSYAMFLYEMLEGNYPFYRERSDIKGPSQLTSMVICDMRPSLTTKSSLTRLEDIMTRCWNQSPEHRHSSDKIIAYMEKPEFSMQNRVITTLRRSADFIFFLGKKTFSSVEHRRSVQPVLRDIESTTALNSEESYSAIERFSKKVSETRGLYFNSTSASRKTSDASRQSESMSSGSSDFSLADAISYELLFVASGEGKHRCFSLIDTARGVLVSGPDEFDGPAVRCAVTVKSSLWVGTTLHGSGGSRLEVYDIHSPCKLREMQRFTEQSSVLCLAAFEFPTTPHMDEAHITERALNNQNVLESEAVAAVVAGLQNGRLLVLFGTTPLCGFQATSIAWRKEQDYLGQEGEHLPIQDIVAVSDTTAWCAVGRDIFIVELNPKMQSFKTLGTIQLHGNTLRLDAVISALVRLGDFVWASLQGQNILLKFSIKDQSLLGCLSMTMFDLLSPSKQALSPTLPTHLLNRTFRPASVTMRHPSSERLTSSSSFSLERAQATIDSSVVSALQAPGDQAEASGVGAGSSDIRRSVSNVSVTGEVPLSPTQKLLLSKKSAPTVPDRICSVVRVGEMLWLKLANGTTLVLSGRAHYPANSSVLDTPRFEDPPAVVDSSRPSTLKCLGEEGKETHDNMNEEEEEENGISLETGNQHLSRQSSRHSTTSGAEKSFVDASHTGVKRRRQEAACHQHTLLARLNLVPTDQYSDNGLNQIVVTTSGLVVTSRFRPPAGGTSPILDALRPGVRLIVPLYTWDAWDEDRWALFYRTSTTLDKQ